MNLNDIWILTNQKGYEVLKEQEIFDSAEVNDLDLRELDRSKSGFEYVLIFKAINWDLKEKRIKALNITLSNFVSKYIPYKLIKMGMCAEDISIECNEMDGLCFDIGISRRFTLSCK